jgi:hypothetical protein
VAEGVDDRAALDEHHRVVTVRLGFRPHCCFRNRGTEYVGDSGMQWMSGGAKRQRDRALRSPCTRRCARPSRRGSGSAAWCVGRPSSSRRAASRATGRSERSLRCKPARCPYTEAQTHDCRQTHRHADTQRHADRCAQARRHAAKLRARTAGGHGEGVEGEGAARLFGVRKNNSTTYTDYADIMTRL